MDIIARKSFKDLWLEAGREAFETVGPQRAELLGEPSLAEQPVVFVEQAAKVEAVTGTTLDLDVIISSDRPNRTNDVVHQNWELESYQRYPVVLLGHRDEDPSANIIGKNLALKVKREAGHKVLVGTDRLMQDETGMRLRRVAEFLGSLAVSVGFVPLEVKLREQEKQSDGTTRAPGLDFLHNEKVEHSIVVIPANRDGAARLIAQGLIDARLLNHLRLVADGPAPEMRDPHSFETAIQKLDEAIALLRLAEVDRQVNRRR